MTWHHNPKNKYSNEAQKCPYGHSHRSKLERAVCGLIHLREKAGELKLLGAEVTVRLSRAKIAYIADFHCLKDNKELYVEAKGFPTPEWRLKRRLWLAYGPAPLEVWQGDYMRPSLTEILTPEGVAD